MDILENYKQKIKIYEDFFYQVMNYKLTTRTKAKLLEETSEKLIKLKRKLIIKVVR